MEITHLGTESGDTGCPSLYATDQGTFIVQGWVVTDEAALSELRKRGLPAHETVVEIPASLAKHFPVA